MKLLLISLLLWPSVVLAQTCNGTLTKTDSIYQINNDGTVTDQQTGLMWQRCSLGQTWDGATCSGSASKYDWQQALAEGVDSAFTGFDDWRLPNIKELASLAERACYSPAINTTAFPNTPSGVYWSATAFAGYSYNAWGLDFYNVNDNNFSKSSVNHVRLVRGQ